MCEHQLSHISDFVTMQSQQNIQELGQTMKTLNHFYDDALKRSRIEVPDENGNETRNDMTGFSHGCANETVQGKIPSDYDGTTLVNDPSSGTRLIGKDGIQQYHHGTAEPEMRGLYILLTIDNDGGMEVMRYAAHLSRERPEIFQSIPVQLALKIYKASINCLMNAMNCFLSKIQLSLGIYRPKKSPIMPDSFVFSARLQRRIYSLALCLSMSLKCVDRRSKSCQKRSEARIARQTKLFTMRTH